jgi:short subunit dehydrogenase-like uncharacterized protein
MRDFDIVVYGSYGFTGQLIVRELQETASSILLAGRNHDQLQKQSDETGFPFEVASINDTNSLDALLSRGKLVIHCGGPFLMTAKPMVEACLRAGTHYTDITGEYQVFETLSTFHHAAVNKGIVVMPGTGFDVVPTDCLAVHLHRRHPSATHLQLAFAMSKGGLSRGTARTMVEGLGYGGVIRENGKLTKIDLGPRTKMIDFGSFTRNSLCIPWGDVSTSYRSTGIPNIEVYSGVPEKMIQSAKLSVLFNPLLRMRWIKDFLLRKVDRKPSGPSNENLRNGKSYLWGKVWDGQRSAEARLETPNGYLLTAKTSALIGSKIIRENRSGYFTPAQYFGEGLILEIEGSKLTEVQ